MARILLATYMVRYPLGGNLSWAMQYALGLHRLGHEVYLIERANYPDACYDPERRTMSNNCQAGYAAAHDLLERFGLGERLLFESLDGTLYGTDRPALRKLFRTAGLLVDIGNHGAWLEEAREADIPTILIDGEPGFTQMKMELSAVEGHSIAEFDFYYSNGANIGTLISSAPNGGREWRHVFNPVDTGLFEVTPPPHNGRFTTVMNWQSHAPIRFNGCSYGMKDQEFSRFLGLPQQVAAPMEVAVSGRFPEADLRANGWQVCDAQQVTRSYDAFRSYIAGSLGEFSVCKNVFVATRTGWFSDRSAAYLASGRPVVIQDTGFSAHLPCGRGLFAVSDQDQASAAIDAILTDYPMHSRAAREIAEEHLDAKRLMGAILAVAGVSGPRLLRHPPSSAWADVKQTAPTRKTGD